MGLRVEHLDTDVIRSRSQMALHTSAALSVAREAGLARPSLLAETGVSPVLA
jgi:hypothetical protein